MSREKQFVRFPKIRYFPLYIVILLLLIIALLLLDTNNSTSFHNVILISIDTLRADHLGCYGYSKQTSPNIDNFAKDSVLMEKCIAQAPATLSSHGSIFTSLIPSHHGGYFKPRWPISPQVYRITDILKLNGYQAVSFNGRGQLAGEFGLQRGFDIYEGTPQEFTHMSEFTFDKKVNRTRQWLQNRKRDQFFLFLHTYHTHHPYTPRDEYLKLFDMDYNGKLPKHISVDLIRKINKNEIELNDADKQHIINTYDAEIREMDDSFGELISILKEEGIYRDSMIIFTSDHGEEFGEHGKMATHSHTLFNELLHVPLIIKFPKNRHKAKRVKYLCRSVDILPSILNVLKIKIDIDIAGISLIPVIVENKKMDIYAISQKDITDVLASENWSIMNNEWKLYNDRLYDLKNDPMELNPIKNDRVQNSMEEIALEFIQNIQNPKEQKERRDRLEEQLKALGYIK